MFPDIDSVLNTLKVNQSGTNVEGSLSVSSAVIENLKKMAAQQPGQVSPGVALPTGQSPGAFPPGFPPTGAVPPGVAPPGTQAINAPPGSVAWKTDGAAQQRLGPRVFLESLSFAPPAGFELFSDAKDSKYAQSIWRGPSYPMGGQDIFSVTVVFEDHPEDARQLAEKIMGSVKVTSKSPITFEDGIFAGVSCSRARMEMVSPAGRRRIDTRFQLKMGTHNVYVGIMCHSEVDSDTYRTLEAAAFSLQPK